MQSAAMTEEKTKGRKRHIAADTQGSLPGVAVHAANIQRHSGSAEGL